MDAREFTDSERVCMALERIADALELVTNCIQDNPLDPSCPYLRMVDVQRGAVYSSHLGKSLKEGVGGPDPQPVQKHVEPPDVK